MGQRKYASAAPPGSLDAFELATRLDRSRWWVTDQIKRGLIPHVRVGPPPPGEHDSRRIYFTPEQVAEIEAKLTKVEYVPADGAA